MDFDFDVFYGIFAQLLQRFLYISSKKLKAIYSWDIRDIFMRVFRRKKLFP